MSLVLDFSSWGIYRKYIIGQKHENLIHILTSNISGHLLTLWHFYVLWFPNVYKHDTRWNSLETMTLFLYKLFIPEHLFQILSHYMIIQKLIAFRILAGKYFNHFLTSHILHVSWQNRRPERNNFMLE